MRSDNVDRLLSQVKLLNRRLRREQPAVDGLPTASLVVLTAAARAKSPQRPGQLASELQMTSPNMAAALRTLEDTGLITREPDPSDGRKVFVHVTKPGRDVVNRSALSRHAWLREAVAEALTEREQKLLFQAGDLLEIVAEYEVKPRRSAGRGGRARTSPRD